MGCSFICIPPLLSLVSSRSPFEPHKKLTMLNYPQVEEMWRESCGGLPAIQKRCRELQTIYNFRLGSALPCNYRYCRLPSRLGILQRNMVELASHFCQSSYWLYSRKHIYLYYNTSSYAYTHINLAYCRFFSFGHLQIDKSPSLGPNQQRFHASVADFGSIEVV